MTYSKDRMLYHLGYRGGSNGKGGVLACPKAQSKVKVLFVSCEHNVPQPLDDMFMSKLDGPMEDVAIETPITSMEGETTSTSQVEGAWIS
jgi:hypothetical protein